MELETPLPLEKRFTRETDPHRWTFDGQTIPWCDPIPPVGPLYAKPSSTSGGLCPALMRDVVEILIAQGRLDDARLRFEKHAPRIATLVREDWDAWIASVPARLQPRSA